MTERIETGTLAGYRGKNRTLRRSPAVLAGALRLGDLAVLLGTGLLAHGLRFGTMEMSGATLNAVLLSLLIAANALQLAGSYRPEALADGAGQLRKAAFACVATVLLLALLGYLTKTSDHTSRLWAGLWFVLALTGLLAVRAALFATLRHGRAHALLAQRVAVLAGPGMMEAAVAVRHRLERRAGQPLAVVDLFSVGEAPAVERVEDLLRRAGEGGIDRIVLVFPWHDMAAVQALVAPLRALSVEVDLVPPEVDARLLDRPARRIAGLPALNLIARPLSERQVIAKRLTDLAVAGLALLVLAPLLAVIALAVRLDSPGPVLFRQPRRGFNNGVFTVFKIRTMRHDLRDPEGGRLTARGDPRVTRVGRVLRRSSLDELPQLFNVLRGEMSVVGPRPHALSAKAGDTPYAEAVQTYARRYRVRPGITGWAQVNGWRGGTGTLEDIENRVACDLYYIENWSIWLDLRIIAMTLCNLTGKQAY